jgi:hypothetical protein
VALMKPEQVDLEVWRRDNRRKGRLLCLHLLSGLVAAAAQIAQVSALNTQAQAVCCMSWRVVIVMLVVVWSCPVPMAVDDWHAKWEVPPTMRDPQPRPRPAPAVDSTDRPRQPTPDPDRPAAEPPRPEPLMD